MHRPSVNLSPCPVSCSDQLVQAHLSTLSSVVEARGAHELAGGIEDWEDLAGEDVDRYGFIRPKRLSTSGNTVKLSKITSVSERSAEYPSPQDVSGGTGALDINLSTTSLPANTSGLSVHSRTSRRPSLRALTNILHHGRNSRASNDNNRPLVMATYSRHRFNDDDSPHSIESTDKEAKRATKWHKMAVLKNKGNGGEGMLFEFDPTNPKVIKRTWKGIPDRWRAAAWYSFLDFSASRCHGLPSEASIIAEFHRLQLVASPDDVQIDLDVPRTISDHVMFRRRYRGGQRLLFRVLHAISLYFPVTGYVQGMAPLAATLLCYYDEDKCFVMLVRMWILRGVDYIFQPGFHGLFAALSELQEKWLKDEDAARKLSSMSIDPTAYATRWYLTLFSLSVPFAVQLRIWDVFLLLGGNGCRQQPHSIEHEIEDLGQGKLQSINFDVLHAVSASIIHGQGDAILNSDFETAMRSLTSSIAVRDIDKLINTAQAFYNRHRTKL